MILSSGNKLLCETTFELERDKSPLFTKDKPCKNNNDDPWYLRIEANVMFEV